MSDDNNGRGTKTVKSLLKRFLKDRKGSITQIMAISAMPAVLVSGAAIDMARLSANNASFKTAVDGAALAIAGDDRSAIGTLTADQKRTRIAELQTYAKTYIEENYSSDGANAPSISTTLNITGEQVELSANAKMPTTLMSIVGMAEVDINATSTVKKAIRPIELVMVMDTTGSMASSGKIDGAKTAAHQLLETLYDGSATSVNESQFIRVGLVPFAAAVRLDTSAPDFSLSWIDTAGANPLSKLNFDAASAPATWNNYYAWSQLKKNSSTYQTWNGCVEARAIGSASSGTDYVANDAAPVSSNPATLFPAYFAFDAPGTSSNSSTITNYGYSYIGGTSTSATGSECKGLTSTQCSSTSSTNLMLKQENYRKYAGATIGDESAGGYGPWAGCAASKVVPMTYNRAAVESGIDAMRANGPTLIAEGLAWGWRAISPTEPLTQVQGSGSIPASTIAPYGDVRWRKVMVLMTDGDNDLSAGGYSYNNTIYSAYGNGGESLSNNRIGTTSGSATMTALDNAMLNVCSKIKDSGIELYVTSFGSGVSTTTRNRLQSCATDASHYQHATTSADLVTFFDHVGENVKNKSIYVSN